MIKTAPHLTKCLTWDNAWLYCACLFEDGYSDWRMPTDKDSISLGITTWVDIFNPNKIDLGDFRVVPVRDSDD